MTLPESYAQEKNTFRSFLAQLEQANELAEIATPVDPDGFELAAIASATHDGPATIFTDTGATGIPVVANILNSIDRVALGLGLTRADLPTAITDAIGRPVAPEVVETGACQEVDLGADLTKLPIPRFFEKEGGPYITAGCIVGVDGETGIANLSYARLRPEGPDTALIGIAPNHHLAVMARKAAARGEEQPIAITLGNSPSVLLAAALYLKMGDDEMEIAGAMDGAPVKCVRAKTAPEMLVPADCEIVIEGVIDPEARVHEGPVSEYHGMYEDYGPGQLVRIKKITTRRKPVYQAIVPGFHIEHLLIGGVSIAAGLESLLKGIIPAVKRVAVDNSGCGRLSCVVTLAEGHHPGDPKKAILGALSAVNLVKHVIVVDEDVDPWDEFAVRTAVMTRMRAERDIVIVPDMRTDRSEPMKLGGTITNYGFVATRRAEDRPDWTPALPPEDAYAATADIVARIRAGARTAAETDGTDA
ncbi:UbiD family decarboxylase [Mangrovicoccus algicola]|uniref:UbiD family decarboxylase n=1 Tax=Mangrovicoccus algicola TaxID=2771008 RepID=A0A8J6YT03_9RHOB|nr:UbiD family decarboxylase [Mangrovicoccus algicola]MBE3637247.1 UbiD family decarboxylase [Mangrovicoccus algicola]